MIYRVVEFSERTATGHVYITLLGWLFGTSYGVRTRHPFRFYLPRSALYYRVIPGLIILHFGVNWFILEIYLQKDKCTVWLFVIYRKKKKYRKWEKEDEIKKKMIWLVRVLQVSFYGLICCLSPECIPDDFSLTQRKEYLSSLSCRRRTCFISAFAYKSVHLV